MKEQIQRQSRKSFANAVCLRDYRLVEWYLDLYVKNRADTAC